jgi:hypothetical protein
VKSVRVLFLVFLAAFPTFLCVAGTALGVRQHRRLTAHVPVRAVVVESRVVETVDRSSVNRVTRSSRPVVRLVYRVDGTDHETTDATPLMQAGDAQFAETIVASHPVGLATTVWVDPDDPTDAYLLRQVTSAPYVLVLLSFALAWMVAFSASRMRTRWRDARPVAVADGWHRLAPFPAATGRSAAVVGALWAGVAVLSGVDHAMLAGERPPTPALVLYVVVAVVAASWSFSGILRIRRRATPLQAFVDRADLAVGDAFRLRVELGPIPARRRRVPFAPSVRLACVRTRREDEGVAKVLLFEESIVVREVELPLTVTQPWCCTGTVDLWIPPNAAPTSPIEDGTPRIDWFVTVFAAGETTFPLIVVARRSAVARQVPSPTSTIS